MKQQVHTITLDPYNGASLRERIAMEMVSLTLWPLHTDGRMTVLINLLAEETIAVTETDDQIDAIIDILRLKLKLKLRQDY